MSTIGQKLNYYGSQLLLLRKKRPILCDKSHAREKQFGRVAQKRMKHSVGQGRFLGRGEV